MTENEASEFGRRIALARRELGLTQRELADRIGVMLRRLEAYESGLVDPAADPGRISVATGSEPVRLGQRRSSRHDEQQQLAARIAALEEWEAELNATADRQADEAGRLQDRRAALRNREEEVAKREQEVDARQAEIAAWARTAVRIASELQGMRLTLESLRRSGDPVGAVIGHRPPERPAG